ncbi:MAG: FAD-dependent oxidoreductase [Leptolyngbyaceae cyanobacterium bins.349]|nr:FAD-dependent oxidoreductase [Leptolyngbyaceae cyanobacterium bins.349]
MPNTAKHARICIIGAGAAGLSTAYYLKQRGYQNVVVLEKNGRVGGLCCSITYKSRSFDLGANYLTPAYKEVLQLARQVGAELYPEGPGQVYDPFASKPGHPVFKSILAATMQGTDPLTFMGAIARFYWERLQLDPILAVPGLAGISLHPDLTQPFAHWLAENDLACLSTLFELPITNMGYGNLDEIPTAYALKYMTIDTFTTLVTYGADLPLGWPKRFVDGFQRLWERISWGLEVHCNVNVRSVKRGATIEVQFTEQEQILDQSDLREETLEFDYLILACPLTGDVLKPFLDLSEPEWNLFQHIQLNPYSLTTYRIPNFQMPTPVTNVIPMNPPGNPWFISQQFLDNDLVAFYTRLPWDEKLIDWANEGDREHRKQEVLQGIQATMRNLGVELDDQYYTYDEWPYFPHVTSDVMQSGFYDRLEALQGHRKTYYVGGLLNFELVETIVEYSKALVEQNF